MNSVRYVGLDVHRDTISAAVLNESGRLIQQSILATRAAAILDFIGGIRGAVHVTFEEGTHSAWLYDLLSRRVARLVVCNPPLPLSFVQIVFQNGRIHGVRSGNAEESQARKHLTSIYFTAYG